MNNMILNYKRFGASCSVSLSETIDINNNTSTIKITAKVSTDSKSYNTGGGAYVSGSYSGGASGTLSKQTFSISKSSSVSKSWTITVPHNGDGTLSSIKFSIKYYVTSSTNGTVSKSISPTVIPRTTGIGDISATIGSAKTITIYPASTSFRHTLTYRFGNATGTIFSNASGTSFSWTPATSLYAQIPNDKSGRGTVTLTTYSGGVEIGSDSASLTLSANTTACTPTCSITAYDTNAKTVALTGNNKVIVANVSNVLCNISRSVKNYAVLAAATINNISIGNATSYTINKANTKTFTVKVTDSRGYSASATASGLSIINYIPVTVNATLKRPDGISSNVKLSVNGNYFNSSFGLEQNELTVSYRYKRKDSSTWGSWINCSNISVSGDTFSSNDITINNIDAKYEYNFEIRAIDKINTTGYVVAVNVTKSLPIFNWDNDNLYVNVALRSSVTLYDNSSGSYGTITLSETIANFRYLEIYWKCHESDVFTSQKIDVEDKSSTSAAIVFPFELVDSDHIIYNVALISISNRTVSYKNGGYVANYHRKGNVANWMNYIDIRSQYGARVVKILGYR